MTAKLLIVLVGAEGFAPPGFLLPKQVPLQAPNPLFSTTYVSVTYGRRVETC